MTTTSKSASRGLRYHADAYRFVFDALRHTQEKLGRFAVDELDEEEAHISGEEMLWGVCELARSQFGMLAPTVFHQWGVRTTSDFGRIVFELVERGEMRKTDRDTLHDFHDVYDFADAFDRDYEIDTSHAFTSRRGDRRSKQTG